MGPPSTNLITFKKAASKPAKTNLRTQRYRCQGYGRFATQCPSQVRILLVEVPIEENENGLEKMVHQQDDGLDASVKDREFSDCMRTLASTNLTPSNDRVHLE